MVPTGFPMTDVSILRTTVHAKHTYHGSGEARDSIQPYMRAMTAEPDFHDAEACSSYQRSQHIHTCHHPHSPGGYNRYFDFHRAQIQR